MKKIRSISNTEAWIFALCIFMLTPPFFLWQEGYFRILCLTIIAYLSIKHSVSILSIEGKIGYILLLISVLFLVSGGFEEINFFGLLAGLFISMIFVVKGSFLSKAFKVYIVIYSITIIPSIAMHIIVNIMGVNLDYTLIEPLNTLKFYNYKHYFVLVTPNLYTLESLRFCAYYDEPGVVGTTSAIILFSNGYNPKSKLNIPVFIAGLLSLSLFFYIATLIYLVVFLRFKFRIPAIIIIAGLYLALSQNQVISTLIFERMKIEDGTIKGDNRTSSQFDSWYDNNFKNSTDYYFGLGRGANLKYNLGGASYKDLIVNYGLIPMTIYLGLLVLLAFKVVGFNKHFFIYTILLFITIYQRAFTGDVYATFIIYASIFYIAVTLKINPKHTKIPETANNPKILS